MLNTLIGFIPITDADRTRNFYVNVLKLEFVEDDQFAIVLRSGANMVRLVRMGGFTPAGYTILGWEVSDIHSTVQELAAAGVSFLRYAWIKQDDAGIWTTPSNAMVAWFNDPDGNVLSVSQH